MLTEAILTGALGMGIFGDRRGHWPVIGSDSAPYCAFWIPIFGSFFAIAIVETLLAAGYNIFNPALRPGHAALGLYLKNDLSDGYHHRGDSS